jgi:hypothetical protein
MQGKGLLIHPVPTIQIEVQGQTIHRLQQQYAMHLARNP